MTTTSRPRTLSLLTGAGAAGLSLVLLASCAGEAGDHADHDGDHDHEPAATAPGAEAIERRGATPRLAVSYDGGVLVLDARTLEVLADEELDGYLRLNPVGDERHVAVSTADGFRMLDLGTWAEPHGDHAHHFTSPPRLTDHTLAAEKAGHVVVHDGRTAYFDDGTGEITVVDAAHAADPDTDATTRTTPEAHHGVAVPLADGTLVHTEGDSDERSSIVAVDPNGTELARTDECPGVHGEAAAQDGVLSFGCEDGTVLYSGGEFHKIGAPDDYGRMGNQAGSPESTVVLADYKVDKDAELERPTRIALVDTAARALQTVELPSSYTFRSLARGPRGEALVLTYDGDLQVVDPDSGEIMTSVPVVAEWSEPDEWQQPRPAVSVLGNTVYVTEPATNALHAIDALEWRLGESVTLPHAPDEVAGVSGDEMAGH